MTTPSPVEDALFGVPLRRLHTLLPGLLLTAVLAVVATRLSDVLGRRVLHLEKTPISPVMLGIVLGMMLGYAVRLPATVRPGLRFAVTKLLRLGIILLGIRLSVVDVARLGAASIPVVVACITTGVLLSAALGRWLSLPPRLGTLIGVGTSICGVSAIAATGPAIEAKDEEVAYAIAVITVFGLLAMLGYPFLCAWSGADPAAIGLFLGTAVHDTSQVNGAALIYAQMRDAPRVVDVAIVTKLVRNLFMIAVIPLMTYLHHRRAAAESGETKRVPLARLFPQFVIGFVAMAAFRSAGDALLARGAAWPWHYDAWHALHRSLESASGTLMLLALSAVGLGTDFRAMRRMTLKPLFVGLASALAVGAVSLLVIRAQRM